MFFLKSNNNNFIGKWKYKTEAIRNQILKIIIKKKKRSTLISFVKYFSHQDLQMVIQTSEALPNRKTDKFSEPASFGNMKRECTLNFNRCRTFKNIQADSSEFIHIGMINFRHKSNFGCSHWVLFRQKELQPKFPSFKRGLESVITDDNHQDTENLNLKKPRLLRNQTHREQIQLVSVTSAGPSMTTLKYLALSSDGRAVIPGTGSDINRCVSYRETKSGFLRFLGFHSRSNRL